jgi:uncharacterized membrane protein
LYILSRTSTKAEIFGECKGLPGSHEVRFVLSLLCFQPLYPATVTLREVAAGKLSGPHLRAGPDTPRVAHCPQFWLLVLWCLAHCASTGISLAVVVSLALVSHHHFNVRNSDRWLCDQRDAVRSPHGGRTIGCLPCSIPAHVAVYVVALQEGMQLLRPAPALISRQERNASVA